jgi:cation transport ATPase
LARRKKSDRRDARLELIAFIIVGLILALAFRNQILYWSIGTLNNVFRAIMGFAALVLFPFVLGVLIGRALLNREIIYTSKGMWVAIILCVMGLCLLSAFVVGHDVNVFLTLVIIGVLTLFGYDILVD